MKKKIFWWGLFSGLFMALLLLQPFSDSLQADAAKKLTVSFIDVGQGNASLIQYKGKNVLIDTGEEASYQKLKSYLKKKNVSVIHNMILTHYDSDHMGSADLVIDDFQVKKVSVSAYENDKKKTLQVKELNQAISNNKIKKAKIKAGQQIKVASGITLKALSPKEDYRESNENSVVLRLDYKKKSFLFTGDIDSKVEAEIYQKYKVDVDVLQIAHHGSDYASGILFLKKASPEYAVISVGADNSYGHPRSTVLKRLTNFTKKILRTDKNGNIIFTSDGEKLTMKKDRGSYATVSSSSKTASGTKKSAATSQKTSGSFIGNKNTKVYHYAGCSYLPYAKNRVTFATEKEAKAAGYRLHSGCHN